MKLASDLDKKEYMTILRHDEIDCVIDLLESHPDRKIHHANAMIISKIVEKLKISSEIH